ncbi:TetR family transcriptional regulator [Brevibacterium aurantiacum]|uniref:TetR family transcriptional regulator n=1 Tax=Brevibacterium aurantiacum TaxID=273384 RepID=A0A2A3Z1F5_BREAU|nr:TetR family transcriptional regulator [Brevibacterium aurantiacum]
MTEQPLVRPGGRSARVQEAVHTAVRELTEKVGRDGLTVPLVAERAGVTPSTVYRRWGGLPELLSDVAVERLRPQAPPEDCGDFVTDLTSWAETFFEEMSSSPGRAYVKDALAGDSGGVNTSQCSAYAAEQLDIIVDRARVRGETTPDIETLIDCLVAPVIYRVLFRPSQLHIEYVRSLVARMCGWSPSTEQCK